MSLFHLFGVVFLSLSPLLTSRSIGPSAEVLKYLLVLILLLVYANIIGYLRDWWENSIKGTSLGFERELIQERSWFPYGDFFGLLGE